MKIWHRLTIIYLAVVCLSGCTAFHPEERPSPSQELEATFSMYSEPLTEIPAWWTEFDQPQLNQLIRQGLSDNLSLQQTWARLRQANAIARQANALLYPDLNVTAGAGYTTGDRADPAGSGAPAGGSYDLESYSLGLSSSYELDLWGRVRSQRNSVGTEAQASVLDVQSASMTLTTRIAATWFNILSQYAQHKVLQRQLKTNQSTLGLLELRFNNALATALDVLQQRQVLAEVAAAIPLVESRQKILLNELSVLLGRPPRQDWDLDFPELPGLGPLPSAGIPADLLANRPDIQAAGLRLRAADWKVAAARADRLPSIRITARAQYESGDMSTLFDNWMANLAGNLVGPLFDADRRVAEVNRARADADAQLAAYRESVFNAVREVEDALVREDKQREHLEAISRQLTAAQQSFQESVERYLNGLIDYLPVQSALVNAQRLELGEIQKKYDLITYRLALHRAIGGTWMQSITPEGLNNAAE